MEKKKNISLDRDNNLNVVKFICAILVVLHHCYPITLGPDYIDPIRRITKLQYCFGNFAVTIFLFIAGLLITLSYMKTKNNKKFLIKRLKRLLPSLIIVVFFTVFIVGPIFTSIGIKNYFLDISTYKYLICNSLLITNHNLPVFLSNAYNLSPNGSLWTLPVEFCCYIGLMILGIFKLLKDKIVKFFPIIILIINSLQFILIKYVNGLWPAFQAFLFFGMGVWTCFNYKKIRLSYKLFILDIVIFVLSIVFNVYTYFNIILIPYLVIYIAFGIKNLKFLNYMGNYSYEIYLLGFLIQQCVASLYNGKNPYLNFIISLPIIILLSIILNKFVKFIMKKISKKPLKILG